MQIDPQSVIIAVVVAVLVIAVLRAIPTPGSVSNYADLTITTLRSRVETQDSLIDELRKMYAEETTARAAMESRMRTEQAASEAKIRGLETEVERLRLRIRQMEMSGVVRGEPTLADRSVLGVWPPSGLDTWQDTNAIYDAGFMYRTLRGEQATRASIARELGRSDYGILEIGAHGSPSEGIMLADGVTEPGWWRRVVRPYGVELVVLMACTSDGVAESVRDGGIPYVVSVSDTITDEQVGIFLREFFRHLGNDHSVEDAYRRSRTAVDRPTWEGLRLWSQNDVA